MDRFLSPVIWLSLALLLPCIIFVPVQASSPLGLDGSDIIFHVKGPDTLSCYGFVNVVCIGDINSDGFADIAFTTAKPDCQSLIFLGGFTPDTLSDYVVRGNVWGSGDFTGDGIDDIVSSQVFLPFNRDSAVVWFYKGYGDSIGSVPYDSLWSTTGNFGRGEVVRIAEVDADSLADMLVVATHGPDSPRIYYYAGGISIDTVPDWSVGPPFQTSHFLYSPSNFGFIDWNGDGWQDVFVGLWADLDTTSYVAIYFGPTFGAQANRVIGTPLDSGINIPKSFATFVGSLGDIDGDHYDDLAIRSFDQMLIYSGGPSADTLYDYKTVPRASVATAAGDVNGDGSNDLLLGISYRNSHAGIEVLLGGLLWDEFSDGHLIRPDLPPYFLDQIGYHIDGAGDFNGDGYGDLLFSSLNFTNDYVGDVFVAKGGSDIITDVACESHVPPGFFTLHQNFPNPFNPSTTISFDLPRRSRATLTIHNIMGQQVALLHNAELSAGIHEIEWDGRDSSGKPAASGIYLYRLTTDSGSLSRKMLLLK